MKTLIRKISTFIYFLLGLFEPAVYDIGSTDNKLGVSAKIVKFISAGVFIFALIWGLIATREIINYLEFGKFLIAFFAIGIFISIFVIYIITGLIQKDPLSFAIASIATSLSFILIDRKVNLIGLARQIKNASA